MSGIGRTRSITLAGLRGEVVHVEADIAQSLPGFTLLGLPDQALQESRDRIRSAARNAGLPLTRRHLTVNLLPAGVHKRGACHDLAIVLAAYAAGMGAGHGCLRGCDAVRLPLRPGPTECGDVLLYLHYRLSGGGMTSV